MKRLSIFCALLLLAINANAAIAVTHTAKGTGDSVNTVTASFGSLPSAGATIIVTVYSFGADTTFSVQDNQGGTTSDYATDVNVAGGSERVRIARRTNISSPSGTFTVQVNLGGSGFTVIGILAATGLANSSPLDQTGSDTGVGPPISTTADAPNSQAGVLAIGAFGYESGSPTASLALTSSPGWVMYADESDGGSHNVGASAYKVVTSSETSAVSWTSEQGSDAWLAAIATYREDLGGGEEVGQVITLQNPMKTVGPHKSQQLGGMLD
jgi:hypothetical protein